MVPDKIYLGIQELDTGYVYALSLDDNGEQEYIRKEALLEWVKERARYYEGEILRWGLSDSSQATTFVSIASMKRLVYEDVIDKLNEM